MTLSGGNLYLAYEQVLRRLGPTLFKEEWIPELTARERWLLADDHNKEPASIIPGNIRYVNVLGDDAPWDSLGELGKARVQHRFIQWQRKQVEKWLDEQAVPIERCAGKRVVNKARFEEAFSRAFPHLAGDQLDANSAAPPKSKRSASIRKRSASQLEHDNWYRGYVAKCKAGGSSPNTLEDEVAARKDLGERCNRDKLRYARKRFAPAEWKYTGKRRQTP
jgi:hypothetical protein